MNVNETCYLFFDFDGTVYLNGTIPEENMRAMKAAQSLGHKLILNTGRPYSGLFSAPKVFDVPWDGMILGTADIRYHGEVLWQEFISERELLLWMEYCMRHRRLFGYGGSLEYISLPFQNHSEPFGEDEITNLKDFMQAQLQKNPLTKLRVDGVLPSSDIPDTDLTVIQLSTHVDLFPPHCDKGRAIEFFCKKIDVSIDQCVCFGDSENDVDMFHVCPTSVCMKNAPKELENFSTYCAESECGVAEGLRYLFGEDLAK